MTPDSHVTTTQAAQLSGEAAITWAKRCQRGHVAGAFKLGTVWHLPREAVTGYQRRPVGRPRRVPA